MMMLCPTTQTHAVFVSKSRSATDRSVTRVSCELLKHMMRRFAFHTARPTYQQQHRRWNQNQRRAMAAAALAGGGAVMAVSVWYQRSIQDRRIERLKHYKAEMDNNSKAETDERRPDTNSSTSCKDDLMNECPLCRLYGSGPCGTLFWKWHFCTNEYVDDYVRQCAAEFAEFEACLEKHDDYEDDTAKE